MIPETTPTTEQTPQGGAPATVDEIRLALEQARTAMYRARCLLTDAQRYSVRTHPKTMHDHLKEAGEILWDGWNVADDALRIDAPHLLAEEPTASDAPRERRCADCGGIKYDDGSCPCDDH